MDHNKLLKNIQKYGIRGTALKWRLFYLTNQKQFVQWGRHKSTCDTIVCGVPQGSVLGPRLILLYVNDLYLVSEKLKFVLFADDTTILCSGEDLQRLVIDTTHELAKLQVWFDENKLSLNIMKTKAMFFGNRETNPQMQMKIDHVTTEREVEHTFLGVTLDHKLCWKLHIDKIKTKITKVVALMNKSKFLLNNKALCSIDCALI
ncbi:hypothetical protein NL108_013132 [Boleophthalmus pectinirostris]|nr:hypothetical protein NL108_013132 [Boleophthalmus pectinirostris]